MMKFIKLFLMFSAILLSSTLLSCTNKETVTVKLFWDYMDITMELDYNSVLTKEDIDLVFGNEFEGFYYDRHFTKEYTGEPITRDMKLYLKIHMSVKMDLTIEQYNKIRADYVKQFLIDYYPEAKISDVRFVGYLGNYNNAIVAFYMDNYHAFEDSVCIEIVGGIEFRTGNSNKAKVWSNGRFYSLTDAYELNILTIDDVKAIRTFYR